MSIVKQSSTGHATNIIGGLAVGMKSTFLPTIVLASGIIVAHSFAGLYGVAKKDFQFKAFRPALFVA